MSVKLIICGRRRADQTLAAHRHHMKNVHGALVVEYIATDPENAPRRYVQNHVFDSTRADGDPATSMLALGIDFVTEVSVPSLAAAQTSRETRFYLERLRPDEARMVDVARVLGGPFRAVETAGAAEPGATIKVFALVGPAPDADRDALRSALAEASAKISSPAVRRCRDIALAPTPIDVVESFWFADAAAAQAFATTYFAEVIEPLRRQGLASPAMSIVALATEHVLHAGV